MKLCVRGLRSGREEAEVVRYDCTDYKREIDGLFDSVYWVSNQRVELKRKGRENKNSAFILSKSFSTF